MGRPIKDTGRSAAFIDTETRSTQVLPILREFTLDKKDEAAEFLDKVPGGRLISTQRMHTVVGPPIDRSGSKKRRR